MLDRPQDDVLQSFLDEELARGFLISSTVAFRSLSLRLMPAPAIKVSPINLYYVSASD